MDSNFRKFIQEQRMLGEDVIETFIEEKIDCYTINEMTDEQLTKYIPKIGDRIAIRQYCRREVAVFEGTSTTLSKATESLISKINQRRMSSSGLTDERVKKMSGNKNATKEHRNYQMGLFEEKEGRFVQVRERRGGGIRHLKAAKNATMSELLETGKSLFFSDGKSQIGTESEFEFTMRDFTEDVLDPQTTLNEQYEKRRVKTLRLYLSCKRIHADSHEEVPDTPQDTSSVSFLTLNETNNVPTSDREIEGATGGFSQENLVNEQFIIVDEDIIFMQPYGENAIPDVDDPLDDTIPLEHVAGDIPVQEPHLRGTKKLKLHRGNIFHELNTAFKNGNIDIAEMLVEIEMFQPNGNMEKGEDSGGVLRDALSEYWETFFSKCTHGGTTKVPMTRHDLKDDWVNIAQVLVFGYNLVKYFPVALAKPFISYCLGREVVENDLLLSFFDTIPTEEKDVAEKAMNNFFSVNETEEWIDFLDAHKVKVVVNKGNVKKTLIEVAHKELIQDPAYIADCWSSILKELILPAGGLNEVYAGLNPTPRRVIAMLDYGNLNMKEMQSFEFLKKFIRSCREHRLKKFLRFCTDLLVVQKIYVRFFEPENVFTRRPIAHTCGCVLELPNNYGSYPELAEEFDHILDANMWVMDII
ncbi:uncharacterized protein LOC130922187 isoform X2 [Corythoichthys intestinalis]|uniref:uncharacterized protein LOC130922187 isoform X2 n=2 Tax=Corythoichthys intestinalis TaxID=161448 RepID=UPI0025A4E626|nr:uncharacterized protein LOC130922187 isoform X2 [Corythoichthys intestinalis]